MTYGWAILIIAVVLAALFQLGIFSSFSLAPRAQPGACQVYRPYGPGSISLIALTGLCNGELPQYVGAFNGQGYVNVGQHTLLRLRTFTVTAWVNLISIHGPTSWQDAVSEYNGGSDWILRVNEGGPVLHTLVNLGGTWYGSGYSGCGSSGGALPINKWIFVAMTFNGYTITAYGNGALNGTTCTPPPGNTLGYSNLYLGSNGGAGSEIVNGSVANVQIYNTSLTANEIQTLYIEGIGGAPTVLQNLVGWWPLNGNANDYSGNNYNGTATSVFYTSQWTSGYSVP